MNLTVCMQAKPGMRAWSGRVISSVVLCFLQVLAWSTSWSSASPYHRIISIFVADCSPYQYKIIECFILSTQASVLIAEAERSTHTEYVHE